MDSTPGAEPRAATGKEDQQRGAESSHPQHCKRDPLGHGSHQDTARPKRSPSGKSGPRSKRKHCRLAAIHRGLESGETHLQGSMNR